MVGGTLTEARLKIGWEVYPANTNRKEKGNEDNNKNDQKGTAQKI